MSHNCSVYVAKQALGQSIWNIDRGGSMSTIHLSLIKILATKVTAVSVSGAKRVAVILIKD